MNYKRLHIINNYLKDRNITIDDNPYYKVYNYFNDMKPYIGKLRKDKYYIKKHYLYSNNKDRMQLHMDITNNRITISDTVITYLRKVLGKDININVVMKDIIKIHFPNYVKEYKDKYHPKKIEYGNVRWMSMNKYSNDNTELRYSKDTFFGESGDEEYTKESYAIHKFKRLNNKEYEEKRRKDYSD